MERTFGDNASSYFKYSALKCNAHYDMAEKYKWRHRALGLVTVVATTSVGTSVFASVGETPNTSVQLLTGLVSMAAVILAALQTFLGFAELQAQHKAAASGYGSCRRDLELLVMKFPLATGDSGEPATLELVEIKKALDELDKDSPTLSEATWKKVVATSDLNEHAP